MRNEKPIFLWLGALVAIASVLIYAESDLLWKIQQHNLFLYSSLFFKEMMVVPGGMLSYLGAFFTQFFYYPWIGVLMLCGWWLLIMWLIKHAFSIPDKWIIITLIPIVLLLIANMDMGYWVYAMKSKGFFFSPTIGTTAGVALLWGFRKLPENIWIRIGYTISVVAAGYPLIGVYALGAALLMGVWSWKMFPKMTHNIILSIITLLVIVVTPLFYYRYIYYQTNIHDIYRVALPVFTANTSLPEYYIPYYLLAAFFLGITIPIRPISHISPISHIRPISHIDHIALQALGLAAMVAGIALFWYKDDNFHHELRMLRCLEQADWQGIMEEGKKQEGEPTRAIVMMHNLALSRLGRQCDEMYSFAKGSKKPNTSLPVYMHNTAGRQIYYHYGVMNECHRMCMEEGVEYGWSVELLQYMARTALFTNEKQAARKYLGLLRQTQYYSDWAERMETFVEDPSQMTDDMETGPITHMMQYPDIQSQGDNYVEKNLMVMLSQTDANDPYFQEQAVIAAMWTRSPAAFWARFEQYLNLHPDNTVPRIFQEAAYLFGKMQNLSFTEELPIDDSVKENFRGFMQLMQQCQGKPGEQMRDYLRKRYGNTYYFEYFFLKDITYY